MKQSSLFKEDVNTPWFNEILEKYPRLRLDFSELVEFKFGGKPVTPVSPLMVPKKKAT